jgi:hypothetical protein
MKLEFQFKYISSAESYLLDDFCRALVKSIKHDVLNGIMYSKFIKREEFLKNAPFFVSRTEIKSLDMRWVVNQIIDNISYKILKDNICVIYIKGTLPGTLTDLDKIARFLDKGSEEIPPTHFLSEVFLKYKKNINSYWKSYTKNKLRRFDGK